MIIWDFVLRKKTSNLELRIALRLTRNSAIKRATQTEDGTLKFFLRMTPFRSQAEDYTDERVNRNKKNCVYRYGCLYVDLEFLGLLSSLNLLTEMLMSISSSAYRII